MTSKRWLLLAAGVLLSVLFWFDLRTGRELVPAIAYTAPIALGGLARTPRWTLALLGLALAATTWAGIENVLSDGFSVAAFLNRVLAALSFTLVGVFAVVSGRSSARVSELEQGELRAEREADLRHLLTDLSRDDTPQALLTHAVMGLQPLFGAAKVVISGTRDGLLAAPYYSSAPLSGGDLCEGRLKPWVASLPGAATRVASARLDGKLLTAGWLRRTGQEALLIVVACPTVQDPGGLLGEVLDGLEPLLAHAERLEARAWSPAPALS